MLVDLSKDELHILQSALNYISAAEEEQLRQQYGDVVRVVNQNSTTRDMGSSQIQCVLNTLRLLFNHVVNILTRQTRAHMMCNLSDESVSNDGDVCDSRAANGRQRIVNHGSAVKG